MAMIKL